MNYDYHTGDNPTTQQETTRAITPTIGRICRFSTTPKRPQRSTKRQKTICTDRPITNGFLKTTFLPKMQVNEQQTKVPKKHKKQIEINFYTSLSQLEKYYRISVLDTQKYSYPYNISLAYWDAQQQLKRQDPKNFDELQIIEENEQTTVKVIEKCDTGRYLHYIPVTPLFSLLKNKQKQQSAQLLLSVFCYLYRVVGVPFYREEDSYLYWMYDMIQEWNSEEEDHKDKEKIVSELRKAECIGDYIVHKIQSKKNLVYWENRLQNFQIKDDFDKDCLTVTTQFFNLYQQYKNRHIFLNINRKNEDFYDDEYLTIDKYISFVASTKDDLSDQLFDITNNDFSQYADMEEPTIHKHFNRTKIAIESLDFENRLFKLLIKLCQLLT